MLHRAAGPAASHKEPAAVSLEQGLVNTCSTVLPLNIQSLLPLLIMNATIYSHPPVPTFHGRIPVFPHCALGAVALKPRLRPASSTFSTTQNTMHPDSGRRPMLRIAVFHKSLRELILLGQL